MVVTTPNDDVQPAAVVRIRMPRGTSFQMRMESTSGAAISGVTVHYMVVEEGVYNVAEHGIKMEAVKFTSTVTDHDRSWSGESRGLRQQLL